MHQSSSRTQPISLSSPHASHPLFSSSPTSITLSHPHAANPQQPHLPLFVSRIKLLPLTPDPSIFFFTPPPAAPHASLKPVIRSPPLLFSAHQPAPSSSQLTQPTPTTPTTTAPDHQSTATPPHLSSSSPAPNQTSSPLLPHCPAAAILSSSPAITTNLHQTLPPPPVQTHAQLPLLHLSSSPSNSPPPSSSSRLTPDPQQQPHA